MSLNKKLKKWNKDLKRHLYSIKIAYNYRYDNSLGYYCNVLLKNIYAYNRQHARYQAYLLAEECHIRIDEKSDIEIIKII